MPNNRIDEVVSAIVESLRQTLIEKNITFDEYRAGIAFLMKTGESGEIPLLIDVFLNATIVDIINKNSESNTSPSDMEGPYFLEDAPEVQGKIKVLDDDTCDPMLLRGKVTDTEGNPLPDTTIFIWSSTHDGKYGGIHDDLPLDLYRGKLTTDENGYYQVESRVPVPYQIPNSGPTGELLEMMGRHSWRPAHVHYKLRREGFQELTTQVYFQGGEYLDDDCCEGVIPSDFVKPHVIEDGKVIIEADFIIQRATSRSAA